MTALALDTSVAIALLVASHRAHDAVVGWWNGRAVAVLGRLGIAGGATHDAMVALAALEHGAVLATRDARAKATYEAVGVRVVVPA